MSKFVSLSVVFLLCLSNSSLFDVFAAQDKVILKDHGKELQIQSLDKHSVGKDDDEYCDLTDPSHCKIELDQKKIDFDFTKTQFKKVKYKSLNPIQKKLLDAAEKVAVLAHNPYSNFFVGAALLSNDGEIITGTNFENAAYGSTICAERAAILRANSKGKKKISRIAIYGRGKDFDSKDPVSPCGACRQVIMELAQINNYNIEIIMSNSQKDEIVITTISELLPLGFGPQNLGIKI
jgi:cytidine deaminase